MGAVEASVNKDVKSESRMTFNPPPTPQIFLLKWLHVFRFAFLPCFAISVVGLGIRSSHRGFVFENRRSVRERLFFATHGYIEHVLAVV